MDNVAGKEQRLDPRYDINLKVKYTTKDMFFSTYAKISVVEEY